MSYSRFGVEINVSPKPLGKLIIVNVSCKHKKRSSLIPLLTASGMRWEKGCVHCYKCMCRRKSSKLSYHRCPSRSLQRTPEWNRYCTGSWRSTHYQGGETPPSSHLWSMCWEGRVMSIWLHKEEYSSSFKDHFYGSTMSRMPFINPSLCSTASHEVIHALQTLWTLWVSSITWANHWPHPQCGEVYNKHL